MAKPHELWHLRKVLAWALSLALLGVYVVLGDDSATGGDDGSDGSLKLPQDELEKEKIEVVEVKPTDPTPGSHVEVRFISTYKKPMGKVGARVSVTDHSTGKEFKKSLEVLHANADRLIVRIPRDALLGRGKLRVGWDDDNESKPYDIRLRAADERKLFRETIGGLALLIFGMRVMSRGSRQYTGHRSQGILARIGRRRPAAGGLGVLVGGLTQFTTTAAGLVVGLVESHLIAVGPAVAVLLGAQLGAAVTPLVLGLASTKEGLLVVAVGVVLLGLAADRRGEAFAKIVLGCGLLFYGLYLLRQGLLPLFADPEIFPYIERFNAATVSGRVTCLLAGAVLTAVLQGPAPVFLLILGLAQTTGRIDLASALAIMSGSTLGAAIGTVVVAWPFSGESRKLGRLHLLLGLAGAAALGATVDLWAGLAERLVPGDAALVQYGKKVLLPRMGPHLVAGFAIGQVVMTGLLAALVPAALRLVRRLEADGGRHRSPLAGTAGELALRKGLGSVLGLHRRALEATSELCLTGHRAKGSEGEHILAEARSEIEALFGGAVRARIDGDEMDKLRQAALATVQLQRAIEDLLRNAEKSTEQNMALSPAGEAWQLPPRDCDMLKALHGLLVEGIDALTARLQEGGVPDLDDARAREIRLNALESESRQGLLSEADGGDHSGMIALRLNSSELVNAYENVGNHLYRLYETLGSEVDQETPAQAL